MNNVNEQWKSISGYEGFYEVSDVGRVKSLKRLDRMGKPWDERILTTYIDKYGYECVKLHKNNKLKHWCVHRLVAEAFISNPNNKPQINHIDGNKQNNHVNNLEWCSAKENSQHAWNIGLSKISDYTRERASLANKGTGNPAWRGGVSAFTKDGEFIMTFDTLKDAANWVMRKREKAYIAQICECCNGKYKTTYGYKWRYTKDGGFGSTAK